MDIFDRIFCFVIYSFCAFVLITSMDDLGHIIGFEKMGDLGTGFVFGAVYLHLMIMDNKKKDKEEDKEKDGVD